MRAIVALLVALTASAQSQAAQPAPKFAFGRSGGNIVPYSVTIARDGHLTTRGAVKLARPDVVISADALRGLLSLAKTEGFYRMPAFVNCSGTLPDIASFFVAVGTKKVSVHGGCRPRLTQLYAVLSAVVGVE